MEAKNCRDQHICGLSARFSSWEQAGVSSPRAVFLIIVAVAENKSTLKPGGIYKRDKMGPEGAWME